MNRIHQNQRVRRGRYLSLVCSVTFGWVVSLNAKTYTPPANHRTDIVMDSNWRFIQQDVSGATNTSFDDSSWTNVNLPHTWDIPDGQDGPARLITVASAGIELITRWTTVMRAAIFS